MEQLMAITNALLYILTNAAPVKLDITRLVGGVSRGTSVVAGPPYGVTTGLKA